jgi:glycine/D-amino acid oxidase-like deaminating enzyme
MVTGQNDEQIHHTQRLVLAAGPFNGNLASQLDVTLPVRNFLQRKIVVPDPAGLVPRDMPFTIFADPHRLNWSDEERDLIGSDPDFAWLLREFPPGLHIKPEPGGRIKLGWAYNRQPEEPRWEPRAEEVFADLVMRGASRFIPALAAYVADMPTPVVDFAGYYNRTKDNLPLVGPLGPDGLYTVAALSGYGTMMACAVGELCAAWMNGTELPPYARHFHPNRFADEKTMQEITAVSADGQL